MGPLKLEALKFEATLSVRTRTQHKYRVLVLKYYVEYPGRRADLIRITLEDTEPSRADDPLRFWFYYQPLVVPWPERKGDESPAADDDTTLARRFASIDLIVYSSVKVIVTRMTDAINEFQAIGFEDLDLTTRMRNAVFSPVRPKITLRRVHREAQIPKLGSPVHFPTLQPPFSFYADRNGAAQFTLRPHLASLIQARGIASADQIFARRSWTQVSFDDLGTQFTFPESTYGLRVFDQHYDQIDGEDVPDQVSFEDSLTRQHDAALLLSLPKRFTYDFGLDTTEWMGARGRTNYRTSLAIVKSPNVRLAGTINRDSLSDQRTTALLAAANPQSGKFMVEANYQEYLPVVSLMDENGKPIRGGPVEESWPAPANYEFTKSPGVQFFEFQVSLIIGFTPIAGEAFGLYELYTAINYDRDAFGNKLTDTDKVLIGIAAALPFVSFNTLKRGVDFVSRDVFPMLADLVEDRAAAILLSRLRSI